MGLATTEQSDERYGSIDLLPTRSVVELALSAQRRALAAAEGAAEAMAAAIEMLAEILRAGGRMAYVGAGSSGLMAQIDALELPGTFGIAPDRVPVILAGGALALHAMQGGAEDDAAAAEAAVDALGLGRGDALIGLAASGSTPFTVAALAHAKARGAMTVAVACVAASPLLAVSHHPILIETPPELVAGSTRMGAGTVQKCALNILSTGVAVRLGHAYKGLMVNLSPDNAKLRDRAVMVVARASGVSLPEATRALDDADGVIKAAIVACAARITAAEARARLLASGGDVRAALGESAAAPGSRLTSAIGGDQRHGA